MDGKMRFCCIGMGVHHWLTVHCHSPVLQWLVLIAWVGPRATPTQTNWNYVPKAFANVNDIIQRKQSYFSILDISTPPWIGGFSILNIGTTWYNPMNLVVWDRSFSFGISHMLQTIFRLLLEIDDMFYCGLFPTPCEINVLRNSHLQWPT